MPFSFEYRQNPRILQVSREKSLTSARACVYDRGYEKVVRKRSTRLSAAREGAPQAERVPGRGDPEGSF